MALEHALLVALSERPASRAGAGEAVQQVDRVLLARHAPADLPHPGPDGRRRLGAGDRGAAAGQAATSGCTTSRRPAARCWPPGWPSPPPPRRCAASSPSSSAAPASATASAVLDVVRANLADHHVRLDHYQQLMKRDYPEPERPGRASTSTSTSCCAAGSSWRRPGSRGSPNTWRPTSDRLPPPALADHARDLTLRNRAGHGLDAHRPGGQRRDTCPSWRRTSPSGPAAASA